MLHRTSMLTSPVTDLKGVGAKMAERLEKIGIASIEDMLFHLPTRYEDRTRLHFLNQPIIEYSRAFFVKAAYTFTTISAQIAIFYDG